MSVKAKLGLAVLVLAVGILLVWSWSQRPGARETASRRDEAPSPGKTEEAARERTSLAPTAGKDETRDHASREEVAGSAREVEREPELETVPVASPERFRVRGTLLHSSDHRPASGAVLVFNYGDEFTRVATDSAGRFATEPVVPRGAVKVWLEKAETDSEVGVLLDVEPEVFLLPEPGPDGEPQELALLLRDPEAWLAVEVFDARGVPTPAEVDWFSRSDEPSLVILRGSSRTDAGGRIRLPLTSLAPGSWLALLARGVGELVSDVVTVEAPPLPGPVRVVLDVGGTVRARAIDAAGGTMAQEDLVLRAMDDRIGLVATRSAATDAKGVVTFLAVAPGSYRLHFADPPTHEPVEAPVEVERGGVTEVELRIPPWPLAATGLVLDQVGKALAGVEIWFASAGDGQWTTTDEEGRFAFRAPPGGSVRLSTEMDFLGDRYEPARVEVPFGTRDLVFRLVESRPSTSVVLEIVARDTLQRIPGSNVLRFREPLRNSWGFARAPEGITTFDAKLLEGMCIAVEAPGYRRRELALLELVEAGPEGGPWRVELERGLARSLRILDEDDEPLRDAVIWEGERRIATCDGDGRAVVELPDWPVELRITAPGHTDGVWTCTDWLYELGDGEVRLERSVR